jgi:hypothetical protein
LALAIYDSLKLRHALAETFSSVGVHGEEAWRAAAQVRVLLQLNAQGPGAAAIRSAEFWQDGDVRWLSGVHSTGEIEGSKLERFDPVQFEALVCWLQLPATIVNGKAARLPDVTAGAADLAYVGRVAKYDVRRFVELLQVKQGRQRRPAEDEVTAGL